MTVRLPTTTARRDDGEVGRARPELLAGPGEPDTRVERVVAGRRVRRHAERHALPDLLSGGPLRGAEVPGPDLLVLVAGVLQAPDVEEGPVVLTEGLRQPPVVAHGHGVTRPDFGREVHADQIEGVSESDLGGEGGCRG